MKQYAVTYRVTKVCLDLHEAEVALRALTQTQHGIPTDAKIVARDVDYSDWRDGSARRGLWVEDAR
jgi:hypothetical protein